MSDERNKEPTTRPPANGEDGDMYSASTVAAEAPADLLELVRAAEEGARVATTSVKPVSEGVIEVGDEAVDAPPSVAPMASAPPAPTSPTTQVSAKAVAPAPKPRIEAHRPDPTKVSSPASQIITLCALMVAVLVVCTR